MGFEEYLDKKINREKEARESTHTPYVPLLDRLEQEGKQREENRKRKQEELAEKRRATEANHQKELEEAEAMKRLPDEFLMYDKNIEALYNDAQKRVGNVEIDTEVFSDIYPIKEIEKDQQRVLELERRFKQEDTPEGRRSAKVATIFEAILADGITRYKWLGEQILIHPPSKFDDYENGIDAILEFDNDDEYDDYLALGVDATFGKLGGEKFSEKINKILDRIDKGELTEVKYFQREDETPVERLFVPEVVLSCDIKTINNLAYLWSNRTDSKHKQEFINHKIKYEIVGQVISQCETFSMYAANQGYDHIARAYGDIIATVEQLAETESPDLKKLFANTDNQVSAKIQTIIDDRQSPRMPRTGTRTIRRKAA